MRAFLTNFKKYSIIKINSRHFSRTMHKFNTKEYTNTDEWLYHTIEYTKVGLTKKALDELSEIVYIEYSFKKGDIVKKNQDIVFVESVKAINTIKAPYDLVVLGNNNSLEDDISYLNETPECVDNAWIIKIDKIL